MTIRSGIAPPLVSLRLFSAATLGGRHGHPGRRPDRHALHSAPGVLFLALGLQPAASHARVFSSCRIDPPHPRGYALPAGRPCGLAVAGRGVNNQAGAGGLSSGSYGRKWMGGSAARGTFNTSSGIWALTTVLVRHLSCQGTARPDTIPVVQWHAQLASLISSFG